MELPELFAVRVTIWVAVAAWAGATARRLTQGEDAFARTVYTAGLVAYVAHMVAAFAGPYGWSWERALSETARISAEKVGVASANGMWWNAAFAVVWLIDALHWWCRGAMRNRASRRIWRWGVDPLMAFMIFNGAVVFAEGPVRWFGALLFAVLAVLALRRMRAGTRGR